MKIKIINKAYPSASKSSWLGYFMSGLMFLILFLFLIQLFLNKSFIDKVIVILFIIWCVIAIPLLFLKKYKILEIGELIFEEDYLIIKINNQIETFQLKELKKIELKYRGYKGQYLTYIRPSFSPQDGANNFLSFLFLNGGKNTFEILLENKKQKDFLKETIVKVNSKYLK